MPDDALVLHEHVHACLIHLRDHVDIPAKERASIALAAQQDRVPGEAGLRAFEGQRFE